VGFIDNGVEIELGKVAQTRLAMTTKTKVACLLIAVVFAVTFVVVGVRSFNTTAKASSGDYGARVAEEANADFDSAIRQNSQQMVDQGRKTFRFDTLHFRQRSLLG
jgi:hypothetical protein